MGKARLQKHFTSEISESELNKYLFLSLSSIAVGLEVPLFHFSECSGSMVPPRVITEQKEGSRFVLDNGENGETFLILSTIKILLYGIF